MKKDKGKIIHLNKFFAMYNINQRMGIMLLIDNLSPTSIFNKKHTKSAYDPWHILSKQIELGVPFENFH